MPDATDAIFQPGELTDEGAALGDPGPTLLMWLSERSGEEVAPAPPAATATVLMFIANSVQSCVDGISQLISILDSPISAAWQSDGSLGLWKLRSSGDWRVSETVGKGKGFSFFLKVQAFRRFHLQSHHCLSIFFLLFLHYSNRPDSFLSIISVSIANVRPEKALSGVQI